MGQWQAGKAQYKDNLVEKIETRKNLSAVSLDELPEAIDDKLYLPVTAYGRYEPAKYFLLDNRIVDGQVGYEVYSPFLLSENSAILVNRGFVPQGATRTDLPEVPTPITDINIKGLLDNPPSKGLVLADNVNQSNTWPVVLQYLDIDEVKSMLGKTAVYEMILRLDENQEFGFKRELPAINLNSAKNTGYAFQWYAMTLALIIIFFVVNTKKREQDE